LATPPPYQPPPSRPLGVAILAVLIGIFGFLLILGGALVIAGAAALAYLSVPSAFAGIGGVTFGAIILIVGLILLGLALGLWHQRMWALVLTVLFLIFVVISDGIAGVFSLGFFFALLLLIYLVAIRRHFR